MRTLSAGEAIRSGWEVFKKRPWFFIAVSLLSALLSFGNSNSNSGAPSTGEVLAGLIVFIVLFIVSTLVRIGTTNAYLKGYENAETAHWRDLWLPRLFWRFFAASILVALYFVGSAIVAAIVAGVLAGLAYLAAPGAAVFVFLGIFIPLALALGIHFGLRFLFVPFIVVARDIGVYETLAESTRITKGHMWMLLWFVILSGLLNVLGLLALIVGVIVSSAVTALASVAMYRALEQSASEPVPVSNV